MATILGWKRERVEQIAARYVTAEVIGLAIVERMRRNSDGTFLTAEIPGVDGAFPAVDLFLANPVGAKTGQLLPTGRAVDEIAGYRVSCVDVAVPMVIARASDFGSAGKYLYSMVPSGAGTLA